MGVALAGRTPPITRPTARGVLRALLVLTVFTATLGSLLIASSGENLLYALISFTTLESPPIESRVLAPLGAFFLALSGMLMISLIVSYTLTLKTTEDLYRKLEGLESQVRTITIDSLEEVRRSLEASISEARCQLDARIEEGIKNVNQVLEDSVKGLFKVADEALVAMDQLIKMRVEELKSLPKGGVDEYAGRDQRADNSAV